MKIPPLLILTGFVALLSRAAATKSRCFHRIAEPRDTDVFRDFSVQQTKRGVMPVYRWTARWDQLIPFPPESRGGEEPAPLNPGEEDPLVDAGMKDSAEDGTEASVPDGESTFPNRTCPSATPPRSKRTIQEMEARQVQRRRFGSCPWRTPAPPTGNSPV